jgi:large subunit ribosomal protein L21
MYAVIRTGGKQHKVKAGDVLEVELIRSEKETVTFTPLLVVDDDGATHVGKEASKAVVTAKLVGEQKGDKVKIFKYRPKTGYAKRAGHRQLYTLIEIQDVSLGGRSRRGTKPAAEPKPATEVEGPPAEVEGPPAEADDTATEPAPAKAKPRSRAASSKARAVAGAGTDPGSADGGAPASAVDAPEDQG